MLCFPLHGADPENLYRIFGIPVPEKILDFSTNTNAIPWKGRIGGTIEDMLTSYPDSDTRAVREELARQNNCPTENILITNGSNEAIYIIASYAAKKTNAVLQPVYGEYVRALAAYSAESENVFTLSDAAGHDYIWLCNPCNPTGTFIPDEKIDAFVTKYPETVFIIDEAYIDFLPNERKKNRVIKDNVIILRSLTKIFCLCGARIGYVLAAAEIISKLKARQPSWSVNELAQRAALAFLRDKDFYRKTREYYRRAVPAFVGRLEAAGCSVVPTSTNFVLIRTESDEEMIRFLLTKGIAVRHTRNFPGLDGKFIRVSVRTEEENRIFIQVIKEYMGH